MPLFNKLQVQENGITQGFVETVNFTGSASISVINGIATVNVSGGGGSATITEIEVDFGTTPTYSKTFTIIDPTVSILSNLIITQSGSAAPGRSSDENEMDPIVFSGTPAAGQFTLIATSLNGPVVGPYMVNYIVS